MDDLSWFSVQNGMYAQIHICRRFDDVLLGRFEILSPPRSDPQFQILRCFSSHEPIDVDAEAPAAVDGSWSRNELLD